MQTSKCRSCGAAIIWAKTSNGKAMPLDAGPYPNGNLFLSGEIVVYASTADLESEEWKGKPRFKSHFATCPHAKQHRKAKDAAT